MPASNAARAIDSPFYSDETFRTDEMPYSEDARYEPRFRVVTRKPLPAPSPRKRAVDPLQRAFVLAVFPAVFLLLYVMFWTMAMRGGYYKGRLEARYQQLRIEQAELEAEKHRLQAPGPILWRAKSELKMQPADQQEYRKLAAASQGKQ